MNILLVSPYNIPNYGAMLQGWALRAILTNMGHSVRHLDAAWMWKGVQSVWGLMRSRSVKSLLQKIKYNASMKQNMELLGPPPASHKYMRLKELKQNPPDADCYIVGSDQVWGAPTFTSPLGADVMLLNFGRDDVIRLAYAVSTGTATWSDAEYERAGAYRKQLEKFRSLSAREESGCCMVSRFSGRQCSWMPDPTLLLSPNDYIKLAGAKMTAIGTGSHIFAYLLGFGKEGRRLLYDNTVRALKLLKPDLLSVYDCAMPDRLDSWLQGLLSAKFVVSNSFHALCFSLLFHRPFIVLGFDGKESWRNERVLSLLRKVNLEARFIQTFDEEQIHKISRSNINWDDVDLRLKNFAQEGISFLSSNLGGGTIKVNT